MKLNELIERYGSLRSKYNLPEFDELNSAFDIGKIRKDSGHLLRDIRRMMIEKIVYYLKLIEIIMNPSQASPIFMMLLKEINSNDLKFIDSILSPFVEIELIGHKLDINSNEKEEADTIIKALDIWNSKKKDLYSLIEVLERNWKNSKSSTKKSKDYLN